jgi:hypothetical protein
VVQFKPLRERGLEAFGPRWVCIVTSLPFASFEKQDITFELRFSQAFALWDRAGALWRSVGSNFTKLVHAKVSPNDILFTADARYTLNVALDRAAITDSLPERRPEKCFDLMSSFAAAVIDILEVQTLERIGTRFKYALPCSSLDDARAKVADLGLVAVPQKMMFNVNASNVGPSFKIEGDDGEIGYIVQIYPHQRKFEFTPSPEMRALNIEVAEKTLYEVMLDLDFSTKKPMPVESFNAKSWLAGWHKVVNRDAEAVLSMGFKK